MSKTPRENLVLIGTGWGSFATLKNVNKRKYNVTVVSPRSYFLFTPMLASSTVGTVDFRAIIDPIRLGIKFRTTNHYQCAYATKVDPASKTITVKSALDSQLPAYQIPYDKLVIGCGAVTNTFEIPGVYEYAYFLKDISHAMKIKHKLHTNLEMACSMNITPEERRKLLHVVIVGGGPTGVEFGAEVYDMLRSDISKKYPDIARYVRVTLIDAAQVLSMFDAKMQEYAQKKLASRPNFNLIESTSVTKLDITDVHLSDGQVLKSALVVWSTGLKPNPLVEKSGVDTTERGFISVDPQLKTSDQSIFALGDCAHVENHGYSQTATVAESQGIYLAKQLNKPSDEKFTFKFPGALAYLGGSQGLSHIDMSAQNLPVELKMTGVYSFLVWRLAYMTKLGRWYNRVQVPFCWLRTYIWGRDSSVFIDMDQEKSKKCLISSKKFQ